MTPAMTTLGALLRAFAEAQGDRPALVQSTRAAVQHLADACGVPSADAIPLDEYPALPARLVEYLREQGLARQTQRTYKSAVVRLLDWGVSRGLVVRRCDPAVRAAWPAGPFPCPTVRGLWHIHSSRYRRFAEWAALQDLRPEDVRHCHLAAYQEELKRGRSGAAWRRAYQALERLWGRLAGMGLLPPLDWPPLSEPRAFYGVRYEDWPAALQAEMDNYIAWHTAPVLAGRPPALGRQAGDRDLLIQDAERMVGFLVNVQGRPLDTLAFADLTEEVHIAALIQWLVQRNGQRISQYRRDLIHRAIVIRKHYLGLDASGLETLLQAVRVGRRGRPFERLRIDDLGRMAEGIRRERLAINARHPGKGGSARVRAARWARDELVVRLLIARPIRSENLAGIRIGTNLLKARDGDWTLAFSADETKQRRPYVAPFPEDVVPLLEEFLRKHRPVLVRGRSSDHLFLSDRGEPLNPNSLWNLVRRASKRHLGLAVNPHAFRHIIATSYLLENPGDYVTMMHLLGHASVETTVARYTHVSRAEAAGLWDAIRRRRSSRQAG